VLTEPPDDETLDVESMSGGGRAAPTGKKTTDADVSAALLLTTPIQQDIVTAAQSWLGVPYVYGGNSRSGIDCSGLAQQVYASVGITVPRVSTAQYAALPITMNRGALQAGDELFFNWPTENPPGHCGIYIGAGKFIQAPHTGAVVETRDLEAYIATGAAWYGWNRPWS
jgi:cell wall-associated NlpC family hydrolase